MASDPLLTMSPGDEDWHYELMDAAESLFVALIQGDTERAARKAHGLHYAFHLMGVPDTREVPGG